MSNRNAVIELLKAKRIPFELLPHRTTYTVKDEAATLHVPESEVLKTVVLDTGSGHVVVVTTAPTMLDMSLVRDALADRKAHIAGEFETERDFPAFELGSMPPLPSLAGVPVFVDPEVMRHDAVIFGIEHEASVRVRTEDLFAGEYVTVAPVARHLSEPAATLR